MNQEIDNQLLLDVLNNYDSVKTDSFYSGLELDAPYYTKPSEIDNLSVPNVLLSGNHEKINKWRMKERRQRTKNKRPDIWSKRIEKLESLEDK